MVIGVGHDDDDAASAVLLLEGLVAVPLLNTPLLLGRKPMVLLSDGGGVATSLPFLKASTWGLQGWWSGNGQSGGGRGDFPSFPFGASSSSSFGPLVWLSLWRCWLFGEAPWTFRLAYSPAAWFSVLPCSRGNSFASRWYGALRARARDKGSLPEAMKAEYGSRCVWLEKTTTR